MSIWLHRSADAPTHQNRFQKKEEERGEERKRVVGGRCVAYRERERKEEKPGKRMGYLHKIYTITRAANKAERRRSQLKLNPRQPQLSDTYQRSAKQTLPDTRNYDETVTAFGDGGPPTSSPQLEPGLATRSNVSVIS